MQSWLGKYRSPLPSRCRGAFHLNRAETLEAEPRVVLVAARGADAEVEADARIARFAADRVERAEGAEPRSGRAADLLVGPDATWMRSPTGERHRLSRRVALRRIVQRLVAVHPGPSLGVDELLEAGWPGERPIHEAGQNRVHVALSTLRKMGLRDVLQRHDGGYRLDPALRVRRFDAAS